MKLFVALAVLALAAPALAADQVQAEAAVLSDSQLDQVTAGCATGHATTTPTIAPNTNVNVSPIIVNQTALAFSQQNATVKNKGNKGKALGVIKQNATNVALNTVNINYHPKF